MVKAAIGDSRVNDPASNARRLRSLAQSGLPDLLAVSTVARQEYLAEQKIESIFVPLGYEPTHGRLLGLERDIGVLFLGELRQARRRAEIQRLRAAGLEIQTAGDWGDGALWGESRTQLLNRVKILLNLPRSPGEFAIQRFLLGMANGAVVVSEPIYKPQPLEPGRDYLEAPAGAMTGLAKQLLVDEERRRRIAATARRTLDEDLSFDRSVGRIWAEALTRFESGRRSQYS